MQTAAQTTLRLRTDKRQDPLGLAVAAAYRTWNIDLGMARIDPAEVAGITVTIHPTRTTLTSYFLSAKLHPVKV